MVKLCESLIVLCPNFCCHYINHLLVLVCVNWYALEVNMNCLVLILSMTPLPQCEEWKNMHSIPNRIAIKLKITPNSPWWTFRGLGIQSLGIRSNIESTNITHTLIYDSLQIHCIILFYFMLVSNTLIKRECLYYVVGSSKHFNYQVQLIINFLCNLDFINNIIQKHLSTSTLPWYQDE